MHHPVIEVAARSSPSRWIEALAAAGRARNSGQQNFPELAVAASKQILRDSRGMTEEDAWALQAPLAGKVFTSEDAKEGPRAFAEKREPRWNPDPNARVEDEES